MSAATAVSAIPLNPSFGQRLANMDRAQRMRLGLGIVLFVAVGIIGLVMGRQAEWRVLYANLADKDGGAIVAQLTQMNVPYKYGAGGGTILVPANQVYDTRLKLASQGLPKGSVTGFELMDTANRFGMTQFQERLTFQRGLEGELTRSIQALGRYRVPGSTWRCPTRTGFFGISKSRLPRCCSACTTGAHWTAVSWQALFIWCRPVCRRWTRRPSVCWTIPASCCRPRPDGEAGREVMPAVATCAADRAAVQQAHPGHSGAGGGAQKCRRR
jgi:hypothetical protein